jgi:hypothetical protein
MRKKLPRKSIAPVYCPQWAGSFEGWSRRFVTNNYWRVENRCGSPEDALQECALIFAKCATMYRYVVSDPKHNKGNPNAWFMAIYKRSIVNRWCKLSLDDRAQKETFVASTDDTKGRAEFNDWLVYFEVVKQAVYNEGPMQVAIAKSSPALRKIMQVMLTAPPEVLDHMLEHYPDMEATNRRLKGLIGKRRESLDLLGELDAITRKD